MACTVSSATIEATEKAIRKAAAGTRSKGRPTWVETAGQPSRTYIIVPQGSVVKLGGYRAVQPKRLAPRDGSEVYRIPLPRKGTVAGDAKQQVTIEGADGGMINWAARGLDAEKAGDTETWSAQRINMLETVEGVGGQVWPALAKKYARKSTDQYDPKTSILLDHAMRMPGVLARIGRDPKNRLGRQQRVVPIVQASEIGVESFAWLMRQSGRTPEEKAHRGVLCSVRSTEYDTLENRVVRDYAQRTILEVHRAENALPQLKKWARECHWLDRGLRELQVGTLQGPVQANQVLRMNPDYRRVWEARKELLDRMEQTELLWCWQGETWNELALCLFKAAMARYQESSDPEVGWQAVIRSPIRMRRGQHEGRWIETDQQTSGIWVNMQRRRILRLLGGGLESSGSPPVAACRALLYEMDRDDQQIAEMDVFAIPPVDCGQAGHGQIKVVSGRESKTVEVWADEALCEAMKLIDRGLAQLWG